MRRRKTVHCYWYTSKTSISFQCWITNHIINDFCTIIIAFINELKTSHYVFFGLLGCPDSFFTNTSKGKTRKIHLEKLDDSASPKACSYISSAAILQDHWYNNSFPDFRMILTKEASIKAYSQRRTNLHNLRGIDYYYYYSFIIFFVWWILGYSFFKINYETLPWFCMRGYVEKFKFNYKHIVILISL